MAKDRKLYLNERTTIRDVAQEAGVSLTTVSHALNGQPHPVYNPVVLPPP